MVSFDDVPEVEDEEFLPAGKYTVAIMSSKKKETSKKTGYMLVLRLQVVAGKTRISIEDYSNHKLIIRKWIKDMEAVGHHVWECTDGTLGVCLDTQAEIDQKRHLKELFSKGIPSLRYGLWMILIMMFSVTVFSLILAIGLQSNALLKLSTFFFILTIVGAVIVLIKKSVRK